MTLIDQRRVWEHYWESHAPQALFQSWLWGEVMKRRSFPLVRFGVYEGNRLIGIAQCTLVRARRGTYLHVRHGPILPLGFRIWRYVTEMLRDYARMQGASFIRMSPPIGDAVHQRSFLRILGLLPAATHEVDAERCWVLDITPGEEEILRGMRRTTRYEIRRAQARGIRVISSTSLRDLEAFLHLYEETAKRQHFIGHTGIRDEFDLYAGEGTAVLLLGYHEETLLSGAVILFSSQQAIYRYGASLPTKLPVSYAVQWEAIRQAKRRGLKQYNFWGIAPPDRPDHPWRGITLFKTGFGGRQVRTLHAHDLPLSPRYWVARGVDLLERLRRGY